MTPTAATGAVRPGALSVALIVVSLGGAIGISLATDVTLLAVGYQAPGAILAAILMFNVTCMLFALVGGLIEWRRPGHRVGRLLMLSAPLYALFAAVWTTAGPLEPYVDPELYLTFNWAGVLLSFPGVAVIAGWVPLLFPTGTLPGPRWRWPAGLLVVLSAIGLAAWAVRPGPLVSGAPWENPFGIAGWPTLLQPFIDAIPLELVALFILATAALVTRYRRGDTVERLQIRWLLGAVALIVVGFAGVLMELALRPDNGQLVSALVAYGGILAMPLAIGIAILRYRLYELDRLISRTIGWALVTAILVAVFVLLVVGLQAVLTGFTQGQTLAVAASTLIACALFQPLRRRVHRKVDRRFDRARYDGERVAAAFAERLRDQVDLAGVERDLAATVGAALSPTSSTLWIRGPEAVR